MRPTCNEECVGELREMSSVCPVTMAGDAELLPMLSQCQQIEEAAAGAGVNINGECDQSHIDAMHRACCPAGKAPSHPRGFWRRVGLTLVRGWVCRLARFD